MAENEGDSKFMTGFLIGFVVGVLICLGVGGTLVLVYSQRQAMMARDAMMRAVEAEAAAREAMHRAEVERQRAEKMFQEAKDKQK